MPARAFAEVAEVAASEKLQEGGPASGVDQLQDLGHPEQPNVRGAPPLLSPDVRRAHVRPAKLGVAQTPNAVGLRSAGRWLNTSTNTPRSAAKEVLDPLLVARTDEPPAEAPAATARADEPPDESPATTEGLEASVGRDEACQRPRRGAGEGNV